MQNIKVLTKGVSINNPNEIAIKRLTREAGFTSIMLECCTSITMPVGVLCRRGGFPRLGQCDKFLGSAQGKGSLPNYGAKRFFILPPRIAISAARMSPMMYDARSTFSDHRRAARRTTSPSCGEGLTALIVNYGVLQTGLPEIVGLILTVRRYVHD